MARARLTDWSKCRAARVTKHRATFTWPPNSRQLVTTGLSCVHRRLAQASLPLAWAAWAKAATASVAVRSVIFSTARSAVMGVLGMRERPPRVSRPPQGRPSSRLEKTAVALRAKDGGRSEGAPERQFSL